MKSELLLKVLTESGIGSRRKTADAIKQGRVLVNGQTVADFRYPVNRATDRISLDGQQVDIKTLPAVYLMLNKPEGIISTIKDERGRRAILELLPPKYRHLRLYPVGRLDKDTTGLLLLTNDGDLTYRLTHPRFEQEKEYLIYISNRLDREERRKLEQGIELDEGRTSPCVVKEIKSTPPFNYSITIHEGKKRQVRRMFAAVGQRVMMLKRVRMGKLSLGSLPEGAVYELGEAEIRRYFGYEPDHFRGTHNNRR